MKKKKTDDSLKMGIVFRVRHSIWVNGRFVPRKLFHASKMTFRSIQIQIALTPGVCAKMRIIWYNNMNSTVSSDQITMPIASIVDGVFFICSFVLSPMFLTWYMKRYLKFDVACHQLLLIIKQQNVIRMLNKRCNYLAFCVLFCFELK